MATKKYKTPEQLKLTLQQYGALLGTRELLAKNVIEHVDTPEEAANKGHGLASGFNMAVWAREFCTSKNGCNTVACIGGTMSLLMGEKDSNWFDVHDKDLYALFYPPVIEGYEHITTKQALKAIDNFLYTGKPSWKKFLPKNKFIFTLGEHL